MFGIFVVASLIVSSSALTNYCKVTGTSCTATGTCAAGLTCANRDSANKVCCPVASLACADLKNVNTGVSDCASRTGFCNNSAYASLMQTQCPTTCGLCSSCIDLINPKTGTSDCPNLAAQGYCIRSDYAPLMRQQCAKSCGFC